jgi:peptidoglycan/LPS O-acetylase OafA/YrhL
MVKIALGTVAAFIGLFFLEWNGAVEDAGTPASQTWQYAIPFFVVSLVLLLLGVSSVRGSDEDSTKLLAGIGIGFVVVVALLAVTHSSL